MQTIRSRGDRGVSCYNIIITLKIESLKNEGTYRYVYLKYLLYSVGTLSQ